MARIALFRAPLARCLFALLLAPLLWAAAPAAAQVDAFSVEVAVADRSAEEREAAYASALRRVLLANSGDKTLMNRDDVREGVQGAESFVETYRYRTPQPGTLIPSDTPVTERVRDTGEATGLLLVRFDRDRVMRLIDGAEPAGEPRAAVRPRGDTSDDATRDGVALDENGDPIDPFANPASALVWLLIDDGRRSLRGTDPEAEKVRERVREIAGGAGLSVQFAEADGASESLVPSDAIRELDEGAIREASLRYRADVVLVGHLTRAGEAGVVDDGADATQPRVRREAGIGRTARAGSGGWQGEWSRLARGVTENTRTEAERLDDVLRQGVAWLLQQPSLGQPARYEYGGAGSDTEALVRFTGIDSLADYGAVLGLLEGLPTVASVYPKEASGSTMVFAVLPRGAIGDVASASASTAWLRRIAAPLDDESSELARNAELSFDVVR